MPSTLKNSKVHIKQGEAPKPTKTKAKSTKPPPKESTPSQDSDDESDGDGVDEEGMARLMKALGDDGLDEFDQVQLNLALGEDEDWSTDEEGSDGQHGPEAESHSEEDEDDSEDDEGEKHSEGGKENGHEGEAEGEEEVIALDDAESVDEDAVPRQKIEIDNKVALERIRETIKLDPSFPWTETLVLSYPKTIDVDVDDDLNRELAFYKQALHGANAARVLAAKHQFPFTRPSDYFAEMVKSDSHMERIRQRLLDESAGIKKSEDKRKEREGKKFGKQVQIEKLKEREKSKKEMEERLKGLKRKRGDVLEKSQGDDDAFDIAVEDAISERPAKRGRGGSRGGSRGVTRDSRDKRYGFGGANRRSKQNTKESTDDFGGRSRGGRGGARGGARGGRGGFRGGARGGGTKRLGKERRIAARSKS